jgi:hypothetical protein
MSPASDPLLFTGSLLHSCVFPPSVLSNGDNKGDCRRIYLHNTSVYAMGHIMLHKKYFRSPRSRPILTCIVNIKSQDDEVGIQERISQYNKWLQYHFLFMSDYRPI